MCEGGAWKFLEREREEMRSSKRGDEGEKKRLIFVNKI